jgi:hypothetical protein
MVMSLFFSSNFSWGQSYQEIVNSGKYIFGEGEGRSAIEADRLALSIISQQLNVFVTSEVDVRRSKTSVNGTSSTTMTTDNLVNTYSQVSLNNCQQIILQNGPRVYKILRYVKKSEVQETFRQRERKVLEMLKLAEESEQDLKLDVSLKYYYWAQLLASTLLSDSLHYDSMKDGSQRATIWAHQKMNSILDEIEFTFNDFTANDKTLGMVSVSYKGKPVTALDYQYFDGLSWSSMVHAKNGLGALEFRIDAIPTSVNFQIQYSYESEMNIDSDLETMAPFIDPIVFENSWKNGVQIKPQLKELPPPPAPEKPKRGSKKAVQQQVAPSTSSDYHMIDEHNAVNHINNVDSYKVSGVEDKLPYINNIEKVLNTISSRNYDMMDRSLFTDEGWNVYQKLLKFGNARLLLPKDVNLNDYVEVVKFNDIYFCRSIPMQFSFTTNNKKFVENVIFEFSEDGKIESLQFALEKNTVDEITNMSLYSEGAKMIIINFLENYKTAFALKRIEYLSSIFSEDALIITGRVVKSVNVENQIGLRNQNHIVYNRQTKGEYIENLRNSFARKEYVNLSFSDLKVTKMGKGNREVFCMEIKQDYFSSNYGDSGYLLLVVDVNDYQHPIIHVRTWQPEPDPDFGLFGPGDF